MARQIDLREGALTMEIAYLKSAEYLEVKGFYDNHWGRSTPITNRVFFDWQFSSSPAGEGECTFVVARKDGNIVGAVGITKRDFFYRKIYAGAELTSLLVHPEFRGHGIASQLLDFCKSEFFFILAAGITKSGLVTYRAHGFHYLSSVPRFFKFYSHELLKSFSTSPKLALLINERSHFSCSGDCEFSKVSSFQECDFNFGGEFVGFSRSKEYMEWRYFNHPFFQYHVYRVTRKSVCDSAIFIVFRLDCYKDFSILHVVDIFGDLGLMRYVFYFIDLFSKDNGVGFVDFYSTLSRINKWFVASGWFTLSDCDIVEFPHLFHPPDLRRPASFSLCWWSANEDVDLCDISNIMIAKQDANMDRPVFS